MAVLYWGFDIEKLLTDNYRKAIFCKQNGLVLKLARFLVSPIQLRSASDTERQLE